MAEAQRQVLQVLLKSLYDRGLLEKTTYDGAVNVVNSDIDLPEFFWYPVCCHKRPQAQCKRATERSEALGESQKEDEEYGCTENQK